MKFSIPTNWQPELVHALNDTYVDELYGAIYDDPISGLAGLNQLSYASRNKAGKFISVIHKKKIKFNYVIDSTCFNNYEWTNAGQKRIRNFLSSLVDIGIDRVTVAMPYLAQVIKKNYPRLEITISSRASVETPAKVGYWEDFGADEIILSNIRVNRDFTALKKIRKNAKCKLILIANECCLYQCPFKEYHDILCSHGGGGRFDYPELACNYKKLLFPLELIRSPWIRPEDVTHYETIGIDKMALAVRGEPIERISRIYNAYINRRYEGNLLDLLSPAATSFIPEKPDKRLKFKNPFSHSKEGVFNRKNGRGFDLADVFYVENSALDNFILHFLSNDCSSISCDSCGYCKRVADKTVKADNDLRFLRMKECEKYLNEMICGNIF